MEKENIKILLNDFTKALKNKTCEQDNDKIIYVCNSLKVLEQQLPTLEEIEKVKDIITELEIKYEDFYEIANYFDPIYIKTKDAIHKNNIAKIREENKGKREMN